jgi:hypothetical protein
MAENFDLIFGQNASQQYAWNDTDYQNGWETIGNIPPTAAQFDALQRRSDTKMKELNDELTPLVNADTADSRQPSTVYRVDDIKYSPLLPTGWFLTCTVAGTTAAGELVLPTPIAENDTVTDGTVTWEIHKIGTTQYAQELATKANRQLSNLDTANLACHVVVDSYYDDTTGDWWREYDDGWIEQGGFSVQSSTPNHHINFLKPFASANCTCLAIFNSNTTITGGTSITSHYGCVSSVTATYANTSETKSLANAAIKAGSWRWVAFGMGAQS